jgi:2-C-methyl-D-erythritol 2,4-cyclodiphosphate synthase
VFRVGHGYDVHRFAQGRKLVLGGVEIPFELGLLGHSDADVLLHAVSDALLGAAALGDIGRHFPDTDNAYLNADSYVLLTRVVALLHGQGYKIGNIDATVVAQRPKLQPHIEAMRARVAAACGININDVNIKATTEEGLGFTGGMEGVSAHAVCLIAPAPAADL